MSPYVQIKTLSNNANKFLRFVKDMIKDGKVTDIGVKINRELYVKTTDGKVYTYTEEGDLREVKAMLYNLGDY